MKVNGDIIILLFQRSVGNIIEEKKREVDRRGVKVKGREGGGGEVKGEIMRVEEARQV